MTQVLSGPPRQRRKRWTPQQKLEVFLRQRGACACGCDGQLDGSQEFDHILELALGGEDIADNLQALLPECHKRKTAERIKMIRKADRQKRHHETGRSSGKVKRKLITSRGFDKSLRKKMDGTVEKV